MLTDNSAKNPAFMRNISRKYHNYLARMAVGWPEYQVLNNVRIAPFDEFSGKSRMNLPMHPADDSIQHYHYEYNLGKVVKRVDFKSIDGQAMETSIHSGPVIFGGPLFNHFGHFVAESTHRVWLKSVYPELANARVAFVKLGRSKLRPYMADALALKGVPSEDVLVVDRPMEIGSLIVGPQARLMSGNTINNRYRHLFEHIVEQAFGCPPQVSKLYLSRSRHAHTGSFYGESYIEDALRDAGFEIVFPEDYPLHDLVGKLRSSEICVFAEGSAIHALELCGSRLPRVFMIGRRPFNIDRFTPLLSNICQDWKISNRVINNFGLLPDKKKHSGFLDLHAVIEDLRQFTNGEVGLANDSAIRKAVEADVEAHITEFGESSTQQKINALRQMSRV